MFLEILMIIIGFILLILGAHLLVKGASNIAKKFNIPEILIGLTIVAIGTSAPELIITITSASKGATDLIIGDAVGSNLCNLLLILGLISIIKPVKIEQEAKKIHIPILFIITSIILLIGLGLIGNNQNVLNKNDGIIFIVLFICYLLYPVIIEIKDIIKKVKEDKNNKKEKENNIVLSIIFIIIGFVLLKYGGDFVVNHSTNIAKMLDISEKIIGLTIVAFGTSLPELVTSIVAVIKGDEDLAVGNLVGSCIFNLLLILGVGAIITPLPFSEEFNHNLIILLFSTLLIWIFNFIGKKNYISRIQGVLLLFVFGGYIIKLFI